MVIEPKIVQVQQPNERLQLSSNGCHCSTYYGAAVVKHLPVADNAADIMVAAVMAAVTKAAATSYLDNYTIVKVAATP